MDNEVAYALNLLTQRVSALEAQVSELQQGAPGPGTRPTDPAHDPEIQALIRAGRTIPAIKLYREKTRTGLAEAKNAVDAARRELGL
jgi:ribosomal protein L7/L12